MLIACRQEWFFRRLQIGSLCTATCASHAPSEDGGGGPRLRPLGRSFPQCLHVGQAIVQKGTSDNCVHILCHINSMSTYSCIKRSIIDGVRTFMDAYSIGGPAEKSVLVQKSVVLTARRQVAAVSVAGEVCAGVYNAGVCAHLIQG